MAIACMHVCTRERERERERERGVCSNSVFDLTADSVLFTISFELQEAAGYLGPQWARTLK